MAAETSWLAADQPVAVSVGAESAFGSGGLKFALNHILDHAPGLR